MSTVPIDVTTPAGLVAFYNAHLQLYNSHQQLSNDHQQLSNDHQQVKERVRALEADVIILGRREAVNIVEKRITHLLKIRTVMGYRRTGETLALQVNIDSSLASVPDYKDMVCLRGDHFWFRDILESYKAGMENKSTPLKDAGIFVRREAVREVFGIVFPSRKVMMNSDAFFLAFLNGMHQSAKYFATEGNKIAHRSLPVDANALAGLADTTNGIMLTLLLEASRNKDEE
jgi:hypothetical protein